SNPKKFGGGLALASIGGSWELLLAHGLLVGVLGAGAINVPLIIYISRWFDRRRGSAGALVSSGQYIAGPVWPPCIALGIAHFGWRPTMFAFGIATMLAIGLAALMLFRPAPESISSASEQQRQIREPDLRLSSRMTFALLCLAGFLCCTPMAMPPTHLVALCSDLGIAPAQGALMLSVLLGSAFVSRQFWGWLTDRIGGLLTIVLASTCQAAAMLAFLDSASAESSPHTLWCCGSSFPLTRRHGVCRFGFSPTYAEWRSAVGWRAFSTTSLGPTGRLSLWGSHSISPISFRLAGWGFANPADLSEHWTLCDHVGPTDVVGSGKLVTETREGETC